jgi:hypothetical protein
MSLSISKVGHLFCAAEKGHQYPLANVVYYINS